MYGGRGIFVCESWRNDFRNFIADMGDCPTDFTIDRLDNRLGYFPENCKWVSKKENSCNRSVSQIWTVFGIDYDCALDAAIANNVSTATIVARCKGRKARGKYYPPIDGYSVRMRYEIQG